MVAALPPYARPCQDELAQFQGPRALGADRQFVDPQLLGVRQQTGSEVRAIRKWLNFMFGKSVERRTTSVWSITSRPSNQPRILGLPDAARAPFLFAGLPVQRHQ